MAAALHFRLFLVFEPLFHKHTIGVRCDAFKDFHLLKDLDIGIAIGRASFSFVYHFDSKKLAIISKCSLSDNSIGA